MTENNGTIRRYNSTPGKMPGLQIELDDGTKQWFNATIATKEYVDKCINHIGKRVKITHNKGSILFIKIEPDEAMVTEENFNQPTTTSTLSQPTYQSKEVLIIRQTCVKAVAEMSTAMEELREIDKFVGACQRLEEYILTGE